MKKKRECYQIPHRFVWEKQHFVHANGHFFLLLCTMNEEVIRINSISQLHERMGMEAPKHPLISIIDAEKISMTTEGIGKKIVYDFYMISMKDKSCGVEYGRNSFDFDQGVMIFSAPGQVYSPTRVIQEGEIHGWMLVFHP